MEINSLEKVSFFVQFVPSKSPMIIEVEGKGNPARSSTSRASMRRMKAVETVAVALRAADAPKKIVELDFTKQSYVSDGIVKAGEGAHYIAWSEMQKQIEGFVDHWWMALTGSYIEANVVFDKDDSKTYTLDLNHESYTGLILNDHHFAKITIEVNGKVVKAGHKVKSWNYFEEHFDITKYLVNGNNIVRVILEKCLGFYDLDHLSVSEK